MCLSMTPRPAYPHRTRWKCMHSMRILTAGKEGGSGGWRLSLNSGEWRDGYLLSADTSKWNNNRRNEDTLPPSLPSFLPPFFLFLIFVVIILNETKTKQLHPPGPYQSKYTNLKVTAQRKRVWPGQGTDMQGWALGAHGLPSRGHRAVLATTGSRACCRTDGPGPLEGSTRPAAGAAPADPRSSPQQPCRSGCSGSVPFTEKRTITGISLGSTTIHPQKREGALYIYI